MGAPRRRVHGDARRQRTRHQRRALRGRALTLRLIRDSETTLICEVGDAGQAVPHLRHAKAVDEGGRGLLICATLAKNWGVRHTDQGKTVWAELGVEGDTSPG